MPTPEFIIALREHVGHDLLWLSTAAGAVLDGEGRVLLGRRADNGLWDLPGGIIDPGEEPADAAVREILEETGVVAVPEWLTSVTVSRPFAYPNGDQVQYLEVTFRCRALEGTARVNDSESLEVGWHEVDSLPAVSQSTRARLKQALSSRAEAAFAFGRAAEHAERIARHFERARHWGAVRDAERLDAGWKELG